MVQLNISTEPKFKRPELLLHPPIPPALHGVNPRTIMGQEWWDSIRKPVYAANNHCCWACGVYQLDSGGPLHAHECYLYDVGEFKAYLSDVVALCEPCHKFIHSRRLRFLEKKRIVARGLKILKNAGLQLPEFQVKFAKGYLVAVPWKWRDVSEARIKPLGMMYKEFWSPKWRLVIVKPEVTK